MTIVLLITTKYFTPKYLHKSHIHKRLDCTECSLFILLRLKWNLWMRFFAFSFKPEKYRTYYKLSAEWIKITKHTHDDLKAFLRVRKFFTCKDTSRAYVSEKYQYRFWFGHVSILKKLKGETWKILWVSAYYCVWLAFVNQHWIWIKLTHVAIIVANNTECTWWWRNTTKRM